MLHEAEFGLGRGQRVADMRTEVERNRLEARLRSARREEEIGSRSRRFIARGAAVAGALFR